eukprot:CAMPEP_0171061112 /NCGR_PEP_ID=MMETSP0766_2-20121228/4224_1 /TAXON_ID=439317 /ORGANISM="Gambierdiscus australes, Strain CAWD 149" /LENGTH=38 /DNA_ID= /DNA_START= /DNA_END= /DNA_ORIENTATION=
MSSNFVCSITSPHFHLHQNSGGHEALATEEENAPCTGA